MTKEQAIEYGKEWYAAIESQGDWAQSDALTFLAWAVLALQERKTGKWVERNAMYICTACNNRLSKLVAYDVGGIYNYCPFCGAEMEVDDADSN